MSVLENNIIEEAAENAKKVFNEGVEAANKNLKKAQADIKADIKADGKPMSTTRKAIVGTAILGSVAVLGCAVYKLFK